MLMDCFISRWVDNARIHRADFRKRGAGLGSTATEVGLIGAVVLVATLAFLFFLGDALQYAFSFVRKDMVTQISNANGLTPEAFVAQWKGTGSGNGQNILNPVKPTAPVVTAGSNGNEAHPEIYKALQELIDRALKKGTMTEAQADLLKAYVDQYIKVQAMWAILRKAEAQAQKNPEIMASMEIQFEGQTYLLTDFAAKRLGVKWDDYYSSFIFIAFSGEAFDSTDSGILDQKFIKMDESGALGQEGVGSFIYSMWKSFTPNLR